MRDICTGRNVLKESSVSVTSDGKHSTTDEYTRAIDGRINDENCFYMGQQTTLEFTFTWPRIVKQIFVYLCGKKL